MPKLIHYFGFNATACGLPFTLDILLSGKPERTTCRNCIRTAAHGKALKQKSKKEIFISDFEQPELFSEPEKEM